MSTSSAVLLLSGGMDSATCLWWVRDQQPSTDLRVFSIDYGQRHRCYSGRRPACGRCDACAERLNAFRANDTEDSLPYETDPAT